MSGSLKWVGLHIAGWVLFLSLIIGFVNHSPDAFSFPHLFEPSFLLFFFVYVSLFYFNAYLLVPKLYLRQQYLLYFFVSILLFAAIYWLKPYDQMVHRHMHLLEDGRPPFDRFGPPHAGAPHRDGPRRGQGLDIVSVVLFLAVWATSTALQLFRQWRTTERRAMQAEADKVNAELSFLKAQINPHFLFNTLNNIYSLSITQSSQTPTAILKLSEILHYITDDVRDDFVPLQNEVGCVKAYIDLQTLRLTDKVTVQCEVRGQLEGKQIAPLLFMTFIENAFKYGISSHEPCTISIEINAGEKGIEFFCRNKMLVKNSSEERTGVGIGNAKKRLEYLYRDKYVLNIDTQDEIFFVHLTLLT